MPRFMVAVAGAAIVIAAMAGCSSKDSSTGSSNTSPTSVGVAQTVAPQTPTCAPGGKYSPVYGCQFFGTPTPSRPAAPAAQYKIIVNGQDITVIQVRSRVGCGPDGTGFTVAAYGSSPSATATVSNTDPSQVISVSVSEEGSPGISAGNNWNWRSVTLQGQPFTPGNAEVSKSATPTRSPATFHP
jgi:hypothetical protein